MLIYNYKPSEYSEKIRNRFIYVVAVHKSHKDTKFCIKQTTSAIYTKGFTRGFINNCGSLRLHARMIARI